MGKYRLGINNCFAVKRWPEARDWAAIIREQLNLDVVQHSLDLVDLDAPAKLLAENGESIHKACRDYGLTFHSTFTGLAAYSSNLLLHPDAAFRNRAEEWYRSAIAFTSRAGGQATGGHVGAYSVRDWRDTTRRDSLGNELRDRLRRLSEYACLCGLSALYVEAMAAPRELSTMEMVPSFLSPAEPGAVPIQLCLDVGHQCVPGSALEERSPYVWLKKFGRFAPVVHLQQSDATGDHHWPFTPAKNELGRVKPEEVLAALDASGTESVDLILEIIPPFEEDDDQVLAEIAQSVSYWREALHRHPYAK